MLETPVAFIIFNRPDTTAKVFQAIRQAQPQKLFVIADGARPDKLGEAEKCAETRAIIDRVDWDCEVLKNYSDINLGCKKRVSSGLDWVFSEVEEAIILEDDCLPSPSFFNYCQMLLKCYRHDDRIMMISGNNFQNEQIRTPYSYYFTKYPHIWGWASWRRAWKYYDVNMRTWEEYKGLGLLNSLCEDEHECQYWSSRFDETFRGQVDTWDYQWHYTCWAQHGLSIEPSLNLVSNLGCHADATHTFDETASYAALRVHNIWEIQHPPFMARQIEADSYCFNHRYDGMSMKQKDSISTKIRSPFNKLRAYFRKE